MDDPADTFHASCARMRPARGSARWSSNAAVAPGPRRINGVFLRDRAKNYPRSVRPTTSSGTGFPSSVEVTSTPDTSRPRIVGLQGRRPGSRGHPPSQQSGHVHGDRGRPGGRGRGALPVRQHARRGDHRRRPTTVTSSTSAPSPGSLGHVPGPASRVRRCGRQRHLEDPVVLAIQDKVGNYRSYSHKRLAELGFRHRLRIISRVDARAPQLARLAMRPGRVDVRIPGRAGGGRWRVHVDRRLGRSTQ